MTDDRRLIEDYLPIQAISAESSREKNMRKGHISTLHLWWARRPLVACRAAVYGGLVPASRYAPEGATPKRLAKGREEAKRFVSALCKYPGDGNVIAEAETHILEAHAARLSMERGEAVVVDDIREGRAPRPRVLDMFAGGGAIPLEALRLGCEAYALDLNPVAHIIQLCTLVYPQRYGKPDKTTRGMTGAKNRQGEATWGGLAEEVRYWGKWVLDRMRSEIGDLYPLIPDPKAVDAELVPELQPGLYGDDGQRRLKTASAYFMPVAYLWTRTVQCKRADCGATVPLIKQTWLRKKKGRYVAMQMLAPNGEKQTRFKVVEAVRAEDLGFDPEAFSVGGNAACPFCKTVADADYVQSQGKARRVGTQLTCVVCSSPNSKGKIYIAADEIPSDLQADARNIQQRIEALCERTGLTVPNEPIGTLRPSPNARGMSGVTRHGLTTFGDLFAPRQILCLLSFAASVRESEKEMRRHGLEEGCIKAICTSLGLVVDKMADYSNTISRWGNDDEGIANAFSRQALPMVWDFAEASPLTDVTGSFQWATEYVVAFYLRENKFEMEGKPQRGSALKPPFESSFFDAVITDPPYYDNVPYADISDFFYVWLKRTIGHLYSEHFTTLLTPKKGEATALSARYEGDMTKATSGYETMMLESFREASRILKPKGQMTVIYAHKTTLGWATLVNALRLAGFTVSEAWSLDTESRGRLLNHASAALASSIFLVARKRDGADIIGSYETTVRPELERIVRERVETLWSMGITGADLVIACVGAGLRAFTRVARVELANGDEVPAARFLTEVEGVVLDTLLEKIFKMPRSGVATVDAHSRFYVLWRYAYGAADLDAGEAIVFAYPQSVELDGARGLTQGKYALVEKKKNKYHLRDFTERGAYEQLGLHDEDASNAAASNPPLIDVLHRLLWLMENRSGLIADYLNQANPDRERLRLVAQALAGPALSGGDADARLISTTTAESSALGKLLANWRALVDARLEEFQLR